MSLSFIVFEPGQDRVSEIHEFRQRDDDLLTEDGPWNAAEKAGVNALWVMKTLRRNCVLAARRGDTAASNRAAELIGKNLSMFIDRKSVEINYLDDADAYLANLLALVQAPVIEDKTPHALILEHEEKDGRKYGSEDRRQAKDKIIDIIEEIA